MPIQLHLTQKKSVCQQPVCGLQHYCQIWLEPSFSFHWNLDINLSRIVGSRALRSLLQKLWYMVPLRLKDRATPTFAGSKPDLPCYLEDKNLDKTSLRELAFTIIHCLFLSLLFPLQTNQASQFSLWCHLPPVFLSIMAFASACQLHTSNEGTPPWSPGPTVLTGKAALVGFVWLS